MTLYEFLNEFHNFKTERKKNGLHRLMDILVDDDEDNDEENYSEPFVALLDFLSDLVTMEADDAFGTEGADV